MKRSEECADLLISREVDYETKWALDPDALIGLPRLEGGQVGCLGSDTGPESRRGTCIALFRCCMGK